MKNLAAVLFLTGLALFTSFQSYGQYLLVSNSYPCEGDVVTITMDPNMIESFFFHCDEENVDYTGDRFYKYTVSYTSGSYNVTNGVPIGSLTSLTEIKIQPLPTSYTNPGNMVVTVTGHRFNVNTNAMEECFAATTAATLLPRKKFAVSGLAELNAPGPQVYTATVVPAVTYNWSVPSGWTINSGTGTSSINVTPIDSEGNVSVTTTPALNACGYPGTKAVTTTDCFSHGETNHNFCSASDWSSAFPTSGYGDPNKWPRMLGDFNGDGKDDVIGFGNSNVAVGLSSGSYFTYSNWSSGFTYGTTGATQLLYPRMIGDFNGDKKDDIIVFGNTATQVGISNGSSFSTSPFASTTGFTYSQGYTNNNVVQRMIGDFNGDGKDDIIGFGNSASAVGISTGTAFSISTWSSAAGYSAANGYNDMNRFPKMIGDFNGDGKDDVIGFGHTAVSVGLSNGTSFSNSNWTSSFTYDTDGYEQSKYPRMIGDFNGDGKDDIIGFGHNGIAVGISTGTSFVASAWLNGEEFVYTSGWRVDAREIGIVSLADFEGLDEIRIGDANGDGKDDIIGFNGDGVYIAYSTGEYFMCPDFSAAYSNGIGYVPPVYIRQVGNFDNTDDDIELIGFGYSNISVMNCNNCPTPSAEFEMVDYGFVKPETGYMGWTVDVYNYCSAGAVKIDASATSCEDRYTLKIKEFNLGTWTVVATVYNSGVIFGKVPDEFDLSSLATFVPGKLYMVSLELGPVWDSKDMYFRIASGPQAAIAISPNQQRTHLSVYTIDQYCSNVYSFSVNGSASTCYSQYRYELIEVNPSTMAPIGSPIVQIPAGGGWTTGQMPTYTSIMMSNILAGKIYKLSVYVKSGATISSAYRYVERSTCVIGGPKSIEAESTDESASVMSVVFPNPASEDRIYVQVADFGEAAGTLTLYASTGQEIFSTIVHSNTTEEIGIGTLAKGTYILRITGAGKTENLRFVRD